ncbi:MAG: OmpA family protein [Bacteroidia bacterium]|nr:OmpA family protein [Bacteroidia bacterium]
MLKFWFSCLLVIQAISVFSQDYSPKDYGIKSKKAFELFIQGTKSMGYRSYSEAITAFTEAVKLEPNFFHAWYHLGECEYLLNQPNKALPALQKAQETQKYAPASSITPRFNDLHFYLGQCQMRIANYEAAATSFKTFLSVASPTNKWVTEARTGLQKAEFAKEAVKSPVAFKPVNLGANINSPGDEYLPSLTADEQMIFYTSRRNGSTGGFNQMMGDYDEDFYYSIQENGQWQPAQNLGKPINTELNEGASFISADGQSVYFTICNRPGGFGNCDIYMSKLQGTRWSSPVNLGPNINTPFYETQPCLSQDGRTLYFISSRGGGFGATDIWYSTLQEDGTWGPAENIGPVINTPGNEYSPFLHADGISLYFSSNYHPGMGEMDLFLSRKTEEGWSKPINLGYPINSPESENNIVVNSAGTRAYMNSFREGGFGKSDIYMFGLDERIRPKTATYVRGTVFDSLTKSPLEANIRFINLTTKETIRNVQSNSKSGKFLLSLPLNQEYAAYVEKDGYLFYSKHFELRNVPDGAYFELEIPLQPIQVGAVVVLENIFFDYNSYQLLDASKTELDKLVKFMKDNPGIAIELRGHTDNSGNADFNMKLSNQRAESVSNYLKDKGIASSRITSKGFGETSPIATNATEEGRAKNRRIEFKIIGKAK